MIRLVIAFLFVSMTAQGGNVEIAVEHFYVELEALLIRGTIGGNHVEQCSDVLTANYNEAFIKARKDLIAWREAAKRDIYFRNLKLPLPEGPVFTSVYEGGDFDRIVAIAKAGDRAYAKVQIRPMSGYGEQDWIDLVVLHRVNGDWLIDDILPDLGSNPPVSMRDSLIIPPPMKPQTIHLSRHRPESK